MSKFIKKANGANLNLILIGISNHKDFLKILKDKDKDVDLKIFKESLLRMLRSSLFHSIIKEGKN